MQVSAASFLVVRHARTSWNELRRIQGATDIELSQQGLEELREKEIPREFSDYNWVCSPLVRARQTANALGATTMKLDERLREMGWGDWEGQRIEELRKTLGVAMQVNEDRGLDFRPPGGESPRDVQNRVVAALEDHALDAPRWIVVTHKGVIRSLLARATNWNMLGRAPVKLDWSCAHLFALDGANLSLHQANISLQRV